jgi:hypothetical protein
VKINIYPSLRPDKGWPLGGLNHLISPAGNEIPFKVRADQSVMSQPVESFSERTDNPIRIADSSQLVRLTSCIEQVMPVKFGRAIGELPQEIQPQPVDRKAEGNLWLDRHRQLWRHEARV